MFTAAFSISQKVQQLMNGQAQCGLPIQLAVSAYHPETLNFNMSALPQLPVSTEHFMSPCQCISAIKGKICQYILAWKN